MYTFIYSGNLYPLASAHSMYVFVNNVQLMTV